MSSQLIVSSSAFVEDLYKVSGRDTSPRTLLLLGRLCVLGVAVIAGMLAVSPSDTILDLVAFAWAGFGASFGPAVLLCLFWRRLTNWGALAGMVAELSPSSCGTPTARPCPVWTCTRSCMVLTPAAQEAVGSQ